MDPAAELAGGGGEVIVGEVAHGYLELGVARLRGDAAKLIFFFACKKNVNG